MIRISHLYYYPVKGLQGLPLEQVPLNAGKGLPHDRRYAIGDQRTPFDETAPQHIKKPQLVVQMRHEKLAALSTDYDQVDSTLTLGHGESRHIFELASQHGREKFEAYLTAFMGNSIHGPARLISAPGLSFTDLSHQSISIINLNSVRALEQVLGYPLDHRRFRANIYIDGLDAWEEERWLEKTLRIGGVKLRVYRITDRCAAINVNPLTGERDSTLTGFKKAFGHINMGVYAMVEIGGDINSGEIVAVE